MFHKDMKAQVCKDRFSDLFFTKRRGQGPFIYYVSTFLRLLDPPPLRKHVLCITNIMYFPSERRHNVTFHPLGILRYHWLLMFTVYFLAYFFVYLESGRRYVLCIENKQKLPFSVLLFSRQITNSSFSIRKYLSTLYSRNLQCCAE